MLGSHLTLNRTLATHILLVRLQPQPLPPPHLMVRSWLFDFDIAHPLSSLFSHVLRRLWTSVDLDDPSSGRLREDSTTTSYGSPGGEPGPVLTWARCVLPLPLGTACSLYSDMYLPLLHCILALVCRLYEMLYPCICNAVISC